MTKNNRSVRLGFTVALLLTTVSLALAFGGQVPLTEQQNAASQSAWWWLIGFVSLALVVSFLCSVAETVLLSVTPSFIETLQSKKPKQAEKLRQMRFSKIDRSLAAILTMNTIAHTVGAIEAGAQSAVVFGNQWVGLFSGVMTLMILFFSEIIPKTLGAIYWKKLISPTVAYIRILTLFLWPLVWASEFVTNLFSKSTGAHNFNRDEFMAMARLGARMGEIDSQEFKMIKNLFQFRTLMVKDVMTPRTAVLALQKDTTVSQACDYIESKGFSRWPVYEEDLDDVKGFVMTDDILKAQSEDKYSLPLEELTRELMAVPETMHLSKLLEFALSNRQHIMLVVDEYGGSEGIVTLEDVIETLLGLDILDESDDVKDLRSMARAQWQKRAESLGMVEQEKTEE